MAYVIIVYQTNAPALELREPKKLRPLQRLATQDESEVWQYQS